MPEADKQVPLRLCEQNDIAPSEGDTYGEPADVNLSLAVLKA